MKSLRNFQRCLNHVFVLEQLKSYQVEKSLTQRPLRGPKIWEDMLENAWRDAASSQTKVQQLYKVLNPRLDDHIVKQEELESIGELWEVCSQIVLKCLYLARSGIIRSVNNLARAVTKWTQACDRRLARLISYIHHKNDYRQYCHAGNTAQHCRLGIVQDSDLPGDLEDSKSTSGESTTYPQTHILLKASWKIFEDNEAVIKMIIKGRSPTIETRIQNRQSCAWLVVRQNQFRTKDPHQNMLTPKTRWHAAQREFHTWWVESSSSFVKHCEFLDVLLQPFQQFLSDPTRKQSAMSKRG